MKKLFLLFLIVGLSTTFAVDMKGKIGMGVGWTMGTTGFKPDYAITKIGISSNSVLEPTLYYYSIEEPTLLFPTRVTHLYLSLVFATAIKAHEKTNLYSKFGFEFGYDKPATGSSVTAIGTPIGFGLEHFISEHFAVDLNAIMVDLYISSGDNGFNVNMFILSNKAINAGLVWYY
jgi:hypothetical protein